MDWYLSHDLKVAYSIRNRPCGRPLPQEHHRVCASAKGTIGSSNAVQTARALDIGGSKSQFCSCPCNRRRQECDDADCVVQGVGKGTIQNFPRREAFNHHHPTYGKAFNHHHPTYGQAFNHHHPAYGKAFSSPPPNIYWKGVQSPPPNIPTYGKTFNHRHPTCGKEGDGRKGEMEMDGGGGGGSGKAQARSVQSSPTQLCWYLYMVYRA
eukprot:scaffold21223_cov31-Tisochrysis_lutea.AAC.2